MNSSEKCSVCGKRGKRPCPATGGLICAACCGSQRGSKLKCPSECGFFPFGVAGYDLWQEINGSWAGKSMRYAEGRLGQQAVAQVMKRFLPRAGNPGEAEALAAYFPALYHCLLVARDAEGKTVADHWEAEGWRGLTNDETVMMQFRRNSFVTVIESQRTLDGQTVECVDLFEPGAPPFRIVDRATAKTLPRYTKLMVWLSHYPYFSRIGAAGYEIRDDLWPVWRAVVEHRHAELRQGRPELTLKQYLAEHMPDSGPVLQALDLEMRRRFLESIEAHHCLASFQLKGTADEFKSTLASMPEFMAEEAKPLPDLGMPESAYAWWFDGQSRQLAEPGAEPVRTPAESGGNVKLGVVRVYPGRLALETFSMQKYRLARSLMAKLFGAQAEFENETIVDLAQRSAEQRKVWQSVAGGPNPAGAPATQPEAAPAPELRRQELREEHRKDFAKLLDVPMRHLGGATPRVAAKDPSLRPKLVDWLKAQLHHLDEVNRRHGLDLDLDAALDELEVPELK